MVSYHALQVVSQHALQQGGCAIPACLAGGIPACLPMGGCYPSMPCRGGLLLGGVPGPRGVPGGDTPRTATAAGGTHPTGMHSCCENVRFLKLVAFGILLGSHLFLMTETQRRFNRCFTLLNIHAKKVQHY